MRLNRRQILFVSGLILVGLLPTFAFAVGLTPVVPSDCNRKGGCSSICDIAQLAQNLLNDSIFIGVFLAAFLFAFAGFRMLVSPTNPGQRQKATTLFYNVIIGFIIILSAWLIINAVMSVVVNGTPGLPWNRIC